MSVDKGREGVAYEGASYIQEAALGTQNERPLPCEAGGVKVRCG